MTKEQIVALSVKLFSIFLFIYSLRTINGIIQIASGSYTFSGIWWIAGSYLFLFICIAVFLWFFPLTIARKLLPKDDRKPGEKNITVNDIDILAYSVLGVWLLSTTVPEIIYWIVFLSTLEHKGLIHYISNAEVAGVIERTVQFCIGIWLMFGARGLRGLIRKLRYAGSN